MNSAFFGASVIYKKEIRMLCECWTM